MAATFLCGGCAALIINVIASIIRSHDRTVTAPPVKRGFWLKLCSDKEEASELGCDLSDGEALSADGAGPGKMPAFLCYF